jgi:hypothetical protein
LQGPRAVFCYFWGAPDAPPDVPLQVRRLGTQSLGILAAFRSKDVPRAVSRGQMGVEVAKAAAATQRSENRIWRRTHRLTAQRFWIIGALRRSRLRALGTPTEQEFLKMEVTERTSVPSNVLRTMPYTAYIAAGAFGIIFDSPEVRLALGLFTCNYWITAGHTTLFCSSVKRTTESPFQVRGENNRRQDRGHQASCWRERYGTRNSVVDAAD